MNTAAMNLAQAYLNYLLADGGITSNSELHGIPIISGLPKVMLPFLKQQVDLAQQQYNYVVSQWAANLQRQSVQQ